MARWLVALPPVIFLGLAATFWVGMQRENPDALPTALAGTVAPGVPAEGLPGIPLLTEADLRSGEVTLVNFWATWCPPCRAEHPLLNALAEEGVRVYGVNYRDTPERAMDFLEELGDPYAAIGADPRARMGLDWGVVGLP